MLRVIAIVLIILGVMGFMFQGFSYVYPEKVADVGGIKIFAEKERTVWIPPVASGVAVVAGVAMLAVSAGRKTAA